MLCFLLFSSLQDVDEKRPSCGSFASLINFLAKDLINFNNFLKALICYVQRILGKEMCAYFPTLNE